MVKRVHYLYILAAALFYGTMEVALKFNHGTFSAFQLTFLRFLIGGLLLLPFSLREMRARQLKLTRGDLLYLLLLAVVGVCIAMPFYQMGTELLSAGVAAVIISMNPALTMVFAHFIVGEHFTWRKALVILISAVGLVLVAGPSAMAGGHSPQGVAYMLVALVLFALFTALGKLRVNRLGGMVQTCLTFLIACPINLAVLLLSGGSVTQGISLRSLPLLLHLGVVATGLGYLAYLRAIEYCGPSKASVTFFLKPAIAVCIAFAVLHEPITAQMLLGIVLVSFSSLLNLWQPHPRSDAASGQAV